MPPTGSEPFRWANEAAAAATQAWLVTVGLGTLLDQFIKDEGEIDEPIPTPGANEILAAARDGMTRAVAEADAALALEADVEDASHSSSERIEARNLVEAAAVKALSGTEAAQRAMRRAAQLALGVVQVAPNTDVVSQIERAAIATLAPTALAGGDEPPRLAGSLAYDGLSLYARNEDELSIELAGVIARLLIEWGGGVAFQLKDDPSPGVELEVDEDVLVMKVYGTIPDDAGFETRGDGTGERRWPSPVTIVEPASLAARVLTDRGFDGPSSATLAVRETTVEGQPPTAANPGYL